MKQTIATAGNVVVPSLLALRAKGYHVSRSVSDERELWTAESKKVKLVSEDVIYLLGLAAMYEKRGENWKAADAEIDAFLKEFP